MRNSITRFYKSCCSFVPEIVPQNFALRCIAALPIALGIAIAISSWQESMADYWREFNTVRVAQLRDQKGIVVGEEAPAFALSNKDGEQTVTLQSLGKKPIVLIFGSYT